MSFTIGFFEKILASLIGYPLKANKVLPITGGSINYAFRVVCTSGDFFVKVNNRSDMFSREAAGLKLLNSVESVVVPEVIGYGEFEDWSFLILQYINTTRPSAYQWKEFGERLAQLHRTPNDFYGLELNNYMGSVEQLNKLSQDWISFFIDNRLSPLVQKCYDTHLLNQEDLDKFERLYKLLPNLLIIEKPTLVHGDLWSGNVVFSKEKGGILIDPAVYFGHREIDLAMTKLFGGFPDEFYDSYLNTFPVVKGLEQRLEVYNLYPLLIHLILFGKGYYSGIINVLNKYT